MISMKGIKYFAIMIIGLYVVSAVKAFILAKGFNLWLAILCLLSGMFICLFSSVAFSRKLPKD